VTSVWVAEHATVVTLDAISDRHVAPATLTLGTDSGTAFTSKTFRASLAEHGVTDRRGGYRDPESQACIESWFSKLKLRCVWREEFEALDEAREKIGAYIDRYHHRPHSRLAYRTPREVAATWKDHDDQLTPAGSTPGPTTATRSSSTAGGRCASTVRASGPH